MSVLDTNRVLTVGGKNIVLIPDEVADESVHPADEISELQEASGITPPIWVIESEIDAAREEHPDTPVYGLWQLILRNGAVNARVTLNIIATGEGSGFFLLFDENGNPYQSGNYSGGRVPESGIPLSEAHVISPTDDDLRRWKLPSISAQTADDKAKTVQRSQLMQLGRMGIGLVASLVVGFMLNGYLESVQADRLQTISAANKTAGDVSKRVQDLKRRKRSDIWPNEASLDLANNLVELSYSTSNIKVSAADLLAGGELIIQTGPLTRTPSFDHVAVPQPDGSVLVAIQLTPSAIQ